MRTKVPWHASLVTTERGFDRIVNFSDATVAIALTLLVLPLVELGGQSEGSSSVWDLLRDNRYEIFGFFLSFLVIWSMWVQHHRIMEYFADYDRTMIRLHMVWLLTVVSIPFTTQLLTNNAFYTHGSTAVYVAGLLVTSVSLHLLGLRGRQHPELLNDSPEVREWLAAPYRWTNVVIMALIFVLTLFVPSVGAWPLMLLTVEGVLENVRDRRRAAARG